MSPANITSNVLFWGLNGLLAVFLSILGWTVNREYTRNDEQEKRIAILERACVRMDYMAADLTEIKSDVKKLIVWRGNGNH